jgi:hypothetical protein
MWASALVEDESMATGYSICRIPDHSSSVSRSTFNSKSHQSEAEWHRGSEDGEGDGAANCGVRKWQKMAEELDYKGYRLLVSPVGKGWRAMIFPPGSSSALPESPSMLEKSSKEAIVAEAKKIVDARLVSN